MRSFFLIGYIYIPYPPLIGSMKILSVGVLKVNKMKISILSREKIEKLSKNAKLRVAQRG